MSITVNEIARSITPGKLLSILENSPAVQQALAQEQADKEAALLKRRLDAINYLDTITKEFRVIEAAIAKQQPKVDEAHDRYVGEAAKLADLQRRRQELQTLEGATCRGLSEAGEQVLEEALMSLDGQMRWLVDELNRLDGFKALTEQGNLDRHAKIKRFTRYHSEIKQAVINLRKLQYARISPRELAEKVDAITAPLAGFKYTDE